MTPTVLPAYGTDYFIPLRYMFFSWWTVCISLTKAVAGQLPASLLLVNANVDTLRQWFHKAAWLMAGLVIIAALNQPAKEDCLSHLISENERIYRLAWTNDGKTVLRVNQKEIIPYLTYMFDRVAYLRGLRPTEIPKVVDERLPLPVGLYNITEWHYDLQQCTYLMIGSPDQRN